MGVALGERCCCGGWLGCERDRGWGGVGSLGVCAFGGGGGGCGVGDWGWEGKRDGKGRRGEGEEGVRWMDGSYSDILDIMMVLKKPYVGSLDVRFRKRESSRGQTQSMTVFE